MAGFLGFLHAEYYRRPDLGLVGVQIPFRQPPAVDGSVGFDSFHHASHGLVGSDYIGVLQLEGAPVYRRRRPTL